MVPRRPATSSAPAPTCGQQTKPAHRVDIAGSERRGCVRMRDSPRSLCALNSHVRDAPNPPETGREPPGQCGRAAGHGRGGARMLEAALSGGGSRRESRRALRSDIDRVCGPIGAPPSGGDHCGAANRSQKLLQNCMASTVAICSLSSRWTIRSANLRSEYLICCENTAGGLLPLCHAPNAKAVQSKRAGMRAAAAECVRSQSTRAGGDSGNGGMAALSNP